MTTRASERTVVWYADHLDALRPVEVTCDVPGYPHRDDAGRKMYENTHFATEREAWDCILDNLKAGVSLSARALKRAEAEVERLRADLAEDAKHHVQAQDNHEEWLHAHRSVPA